MESDNSVIESAIVYKTVLYFVIHIVTGERLSTPNAIEDTDSTGALLVNSKKRQGG